MTSTASLACGACTAAVLVCLTTGDGVATRHIDANVGNRRTSAFLPVMPPMGTPVTGRIRSHPLEAHKMYYVCQGGTRLSQRRHERLGTRTAVMVVKTDVEISDKRDVDPEVGSSSKSTDHTGVSRFGSAMPKSAEGVGPPPAPQDNFKHKSLAGVPTDYGPYLTIKGFKINAFGFFFCFMAILWAIPWAVFLVVYKALLEFVDKLDPCRYNVDRSSSLWGWLTSLSTDSLPEMTGLENIPDGPAVFVANHASWMDVPYSAQLPVRAKYLAKADLTKVPILGNAMSMAQHVLVDRDDKRSQIEALRSALLILKTGTPLFVFPEGTRGPGGKMQAFKMGAFKVATKAGVPIVPVSIAGTHIMMPKEVIMPQCAGRGITAIHVHPAIPSTDRTDQELSDLAFKIINDALPNEQQCESTSKETGGA